MLLLAGCGDITGTRADRTLGLWVGETGIVLEVGESVELSARLQVPDGSVRAREAGTAIIPAWDARWASDDGAVVRIADATSGVIEGVGAGRTTVWVHAGGRRDSATVTVRTAGEEPSHRWKTVATYASGACALDVGGHAYCWGDDFWGGLGTGSERRQWTNTYRPVRVDTPLVFDEIGRGLGFACGRTSSGEIWCWGLHLGAHLGHGRVDVDYEVRPVRVDLPESAASLGVGALHACALDGDGRAHCWGNNMAFQLGVAADIVTSAERGGRTVAVSFDRGFDVLAVGDYTSCGITAEGDLFCWGSTYGGAPGLGELTRTPSRIATTEPVRSVHPGGGGCFLNWEGQVFCWGLMRLAPTGMHQVPTLAAIERRFEQLSGACGLKHDGTAWCWGSRAFQLLDPAAATEPCGVPTNELCSSHPVAAPGGLRFASLSASEAACGVTVEGALYCWGGNQRGQLGSGRPGLEATHVPQRVQDPL